MSEQGEAVVAQGKRLIRQAQYHEAIELLKPWVGENSDEASGWGALGAAYFELEDWALPKALRALPKDQKAALAKALSDEEAEERASTMSPSVPTLRRPCVRWTSGTTRASGRCRTPSLAMRRVGDA